MNVHCHAGSVPGAANPPVRMGPCISGFFDSEPHVVPPASSRTGRWEPLWLLMGSILIPRSRSEVSQQQGRPKVGGQWGRGRGLGMNHPGEPCTAYRAAGGPGLRLSSGYVLTHPNQKAAKGVWPHASAAAENL